MIKNIKNMYILPRIYKDSIPELARIIEVIAVQRLNRKH